MNTMQVALLKVGAVTHTDVERIHEQDEARKKKKKKKKSEALSRLLRPVRKELEALIGEKELSVLLAAEGSLNSVLDGVRAAALKMAVAQHARGDLAGVADAGFVMARLNIIIDIKNHSSSKGGRRVK